MLIHRMEVILELRREIQKSKVEDRTGNLRIELDAGGEVNIAGGQAVFEVASIWIGTNETIFASGQWAAPGPDIPKNAYLQGNGFYYSPAPIDVQALIGNLIKASQQ